MAWSPTSLVSCEAPVRCLSDGSLVGLQKRQEGLLVMKGQQAPFQDGKSALRERERASATHPLPGKQPPALGTSLGTY
jgi:hypothetical protein